MHMDPDVWENPEEFRPSRFLDADGSLLKPQEFIPFQTGKVFLFYILKDGEMEWGKREKE